MPDLTAKRTLVKSPPELWSELSEVERLARHLGAFGEIKITKLEPEHTVAWEGEGASGTVSIEPSGWGTKVTLTAQLGRAEVETGGDVGEIAETKVEEPATTEAAAEVLMLAPPEAEDCELEESVMTEAVVQAPEVEESHAEEPEAEEPQVEEPLVEEPQVEEPQVDEPDAEEPPRAMEPPAGDPVEPIGTKPRRKRGLFGWLFRQRTSAQLDAPPAPEPSAPVMEAPMVEEAPILEEAPVVEEAPVIDEAPLDKPVAEEPPAVEETRANEPVADKPPVAEEPPIAEEPQGGEGWPVANEGPVAEEPPVADELPGDEPAPAADEPPILGDASTDETTGQDARLDPDRAQAILDGALDALGSAHHRPFSRG
jgi:hypothetical protein